MALQLTEFVAEFESRLAAVACEAALASDAAAAAHSVYQGAQSLLALVASAGRDDLSGLAEQLKPTAAASAEAWVAGAEKTWGRWKSTTLANLSEEASAEDASADPPSHHQSASSEGSEPAAVDPAMLALDDERDTQIEQDVENLRADAEMASMFFSEAHDHLALIETAVLELEGRPDDAKLLNDIFRSYHTIKGNAGVVAVKSIQEFAHRVENLLDQGRSGRIVIGPDAIDVILKSIDILGAVLAELTKRLAGEPGTSYLAQRRAVMATVDRILRGGAQEATPAGSAAQTAARSAAPLAEENSTSAAERASGPPREESVAPPEATSTAAVAPASSESEGAAFFAAPAVAQTQAASVSAPTPPVPSVPDVSAGPATRKKDAAEPSPSRRSDDVAQASVKVDTRKLDNLVDTVGELVVVQSIISEHPRLQAAADEQLTRNLAQLGRITSELQRNAMSMRMVPIRQTFQKMARLVRDLCRASGKHIDLVLSGEDTELDRKVVEDINDPLMHMIRNSADHGIEPNDVRRSLGKTLPAQLRLSAFHQGGNIVITIADDGAGLNTEKILAKAIAQGVVAAGAPMAPAEIHQLIFKPGFSTADKVTEISGRGVGMDVVRRNIEALRGRIDIQTEKGRGTTFAIKLPLTLAILEGLVLRVGTERFVLPTFSVRESLRPTAEQIQLVQGQPRMIQVRGSLLPLAWLADVIGVGASLTDPTQGTVVVVEDDGRYLGLLVDELVGKQEVVIKSLGDTFKQVRGIAGGAILGDGRIGLILDASGVAGMLSRSSSYAA